MSIRLFIADDHQIILDGFCSIFEVVEDIEVVGKGKNGKEVLTFLENNTVDIILLDINMPILNGVETCKMVNRDYPDVQVIALSMFDQQSYLKRMIQHGARGYLLKDDSATEIEQAIRTVYQGDRYVSSQLKDMLASIDFLLGSNKKGLIDISEREQQVLELLSEGLTDQQIGDKLFISFHTSKTHRKNLLSKFNAKNAAELIKMALEKGFI